LRLCAAIILASVTALASAPTPAQAVEPGEVLSDPALESRARGLSAKLRCLVCQNQSIDDSNAPLAKDLRLLVRERLKAGDDDQAVMSYVVARYGDFVLLTPPLKISTLLLWIAPLLGLVGIGYAMVRATGLIGAAKAVPAGGGEARLSAAEEARLRALIGDGPGPKQG
jgi:cytochrome c-type biogenesis protein CcmH